jgi:hypothetical protein
VSPRRNANARKQRGKKSKREKETKNAQKESK